MIFTIYKIQPYLIWTQCFGDTNIKHIIGLQCSKIFPFVKCCDPNDQSEESITKSSIE